MKASQLAHSLGVLLPLLDSQVWALDTKRGTFANPPPSSRPFFRYWLPDAGVDPELVAQDIADAGKIGMGGVEFLPYYNYGGEMGGYPDGADWSRFGFGTPAFQAIFRRALEAHRNNDMLMDFAIGPNQGQGVPAEPDDEGLQRDLIPYAEPIPSNARTIDLPGWGEGDLVAAVTGLVTANASQSSDPAYLELTIREGSLKVATHKVSRQGKVHIAALDLEPGLGEQWLFSFYERRTLAKNLDFPRNSPRTIFDNGSFVVDHFSAQGAHTVIQFWEKHILGRGMDKLLSQAGHYGWEDSLEVLSNISWTPRLPQLFKKQHGYDIAPYLPLIMWSNNNINIQKDRPGKIRAILDSETQGAGYVNAYRATLQVGYQEYLKTLSKWTKNRLGLPMSSQVSYNMPMDAAASVPYVDVPECESLQWRDNIDGYRQFSGVAALAGQHIVSNEMGAKLLNSFKHSIPDLLRSIHRAFAGGVNRVVIHGQTYAHNYFNTTWPGYAAWQYVVSEEYSNKFPAWEKGLDEAMEYVARLQYTLQAGRALVDVALYNKVSASDPNFQSFLDPSQFLKAGYSYRYLTPDVFNLPNAKVTKGLLASNSAAFKALVVPTEHGEMTLDGAKGLVRFARSGLPIIFEGEPKYYTMNSGDHDDVRRTLDVLFKSPNVHRCANGTSVEVLHKIGITPRVSTNVNGTLHTAWRRDDKNDIDFIFLFADEKTSSGHIEIESLGFPYIFDAFSGRISPLLRYSASTAQGSTRIPIELVSGQAIVLGFSKKRLHGVERPNFSIIELPSGVLESVYTQEDGLILHVPNQLSSKGKVILSNGRTQELKRPCGLVKPQFELDSWALHVEHWEAPTDLGDADVVAVQRNTTHQLNGPLPEWSKTPSLANVSGIGYYETTFNWTGNSDRHGAYLTLNGVLHAAQILVNGHKTTPVNCFKASADIGPFLRVGENKVTIIVPTTMWNYLRSFGDQILSTGAPPLVVYGLHGPPRTFTAPGLSENGLLGHVIVTPYEKVVVKW
ncbi:hypothetical protein CC79DRAFT_1388306 [Sarocladium strictum]